MKWKLEEELKSSRPQQDQKQQVTRNNTNNTRINGTTITRKQKCKEKQLYGHFKRPTSEISHKKTWI